VSKATRPAPARAIPIPATGNPVHSAPRAVRPGHVVHPHEPICPACGSFDVTTDEVDTGDGIDETAWICEACGAAWPLACIVEWR
jgi:hypothetical protein